MNPDYGEAEMNLYAAALDRGFDDRPEPGACPRCGGLSFLRTRALRVPWRCAACCPRGPAEDAEAWPPGQVDRPSEAPFDAGSFFS